MNNTCRYFLFSFVLSSFSYFAYPQLLTENEIYTIFQHNPDAGQKFDKPLQEASNEFDIIVATAFLIYKKVISSQDKPSCVFTPSCSEYAVEAFQKKGMIIGWLQTFDRLSRCHGFVNQSHYSLDREKIRFYDPVQ